MSFAVHELTRGWTFRETGSKDEWLRVARVPTNVHLDLLANNKYVIMYPRLAPQCLT
jgi:beta-mannosidase